MWFHYNPAQNVPRSGNMLGRGSERYLAKGEERSNFMGEQGGGSNLRSGGWGRYDRGGQELTGKRIWGLAMAVSKRRRGGRGEGASG